MGFPPGSIIDLASEIIENICFTKMNTTANSLRITAVEKKMGDFLQETSAFHGPYEENVASDFKHVFQVT